VLEVGLNDIILHLRLRHLALGNCRMVALAFLSLYAVFVDVPEVSNCVKMAFFCCLFIVFDGVFDLLTPSGISFLEQLDWVDHSLLKELGYLVHSFRVLHRGRLDIVLASLIQVATDVLPFLVKAAQNIADQWIDNKICLSVQGLSGLGLINLGNV
jgi:hypothetical protein